ncbi:MAG: 30S ribosome-binding factor RbfA [Rubripirellula sp.]
MTSRRLLKAAEAIREVVAASILTELRDPRVQDVTVVGVQVSPDMREAKIAVSIMGDESQQQLSLRGLQNAAGFLQSKIAARIDARHTPRLQFVIDKGIQQSLLVGEILEKIKREKDDSGNAGPDPEADPGPVVDAESKNPDAEPVDGERKPQNSGNASSTDSESSSVQSQSQVDKAAEPNPAHPSGDPPRS